MVGATCVGHMEIESDYAETEALSLDLTVEVCYNLTIITQLLLRIMLRIAIHRGAT